MTRKKRIEQDDTTLFDKALNELPADIKIEVAISFDIAKRLRLLLNKKFSGKQSELAKYMGKTEAEISKWFSGTHNFTLQTLAKLEAAFGEPIISVPSHEERVVLEDMVVEFSNFGHAIYWGDRRDFPLVFSNTECAPYTQRLSHSLQTLFSDIYSISLHRDYLPAYMKGDISIPNSNQVLA